MEDNKVIEATKAEEKVTVEAKETASTKPENPNSSKEFKGKRNFRGKGGRRDNRERAPKEYEERVVTINRVSKTVKGGRRMKFSSLVVIGNGKGKYGFGTGKSTEVPDAIKKAVDAAKANTFMVHMVKGDTIPHEVIGKFGATKVFLKPAPEGTGIIAGGPVRAILELSGVKNVYSKVYGSRTAINIIRATNDGLLNLKSYKTVMQLRKGGTENVK